MSIAAESGAKSKAIEILDWNSLVQYTSFLCQGDETKMKIFLIDEEKEKILLKSKQEFDNNIQYAREQGLISITFLIYKEEQLLFEGFYHIEKISLRFPSDKLKSLEEKALSEKWYIPVKQGEPLDLCLKASIEFIRNRRTCPELEKFIIFVLPATFGKLLNTSSVYTWPRDIQNGIFELAETLIDLVAIRIERPPVPVSLLEVLSLVFDSTSAFGKRHRTKTFPSQRSYSLVDDEFLKKSDATERFGWLKSFLQRFLSQNGLKNVRALFDHVDNSDPRKSGTELEILFRVFLNCSDCVDSECFRKIFKDPIDRALNFLKEKKVFDETQKLDETLSEIMRIYQIPQGIDETLASAFNPQISEKSTENFIEAVSSVARKSRTFDGTEQITEDLINLSVEKNDEDQKSVKKQRTTEQPTATLFNRTDLIQCIDEMLKKNEKTSSKRKYRRAPTAPNQVSSTDDSIVSTRNSFPPKYDRSKPEEILRFFGAMKLKVEQLYIEREFAVSNGNLRDVLKVEEKLKLLKPYSARFIADENMPDGTIMKGGERFEKCWIVFNDGSLPWDSEGVELINLCDGIEVIRKPVVPVTAPHSKTTITVEFLSSNTPGTYESKWILSYRNRTFGPMIWCSIEVRQSTESLQSNPIFTQSNSEMFTENLDFVEVSLPDCFDLSKPFQSQRSRSTSFLESISSDFSATNFTSLTESTNEEQKNSLSSATKEEENCRASASTDFVELFVNNICSVTSQARNTAKAIFNTLQAIDESQVKLPEKNKPDEEEKSQISLVNSYQFVGRQRPVEPMTQLIEMGFTDRNKNQRLLRENFDDLEKVVEILMLQNQEDSNWFNHRH